MYKKIKLISLISIITILLCSCKTALPGKNYPKEDAAGTGYSTATKSNIYIEDFYFLTVGTLKADVELLTGTPHYINNNDPLLPVYTLANGDSISIEYDKEKTTVKLAKYDYKTGETENFFDILVELGILKSAGQETSGSTTIVPDISEPVEDNPVLPENNPTTPEQNTSVTKPAQGDVFASGTYNYTIIEATLSQGMPRTKVVSEIGKPNYFFSHNFSGDSYIIDCYNLNDGSKLYLDYGYERSNLRCAAIYKNGTFTSVLDGLAWSEQKKPSGFTRSASDINKVTRLNKNSTPAKVYSIIGEPCWYEGTRGNYSDVYTLNNGALAYLNFGSAHNKLTSISIKEEDGSVTVVTLH